MELLKFAFCRIMVVDEKIDEVRSIEDLKDVCYLDDLINLLLINQAECGLTNEQFLKAGADAYKMRKEGKKYGITL